MKERKRKERELQKARKRMEGLPAVHAGVVLRVSTARAPPLVCSNGRQQLQQHVSFREWMSCPSQLHHASSRTRRDRQKNCTAGGFSHSHVNSIVRTCASAVADAVEVSESFEPNSRVKLSVKVAPKICKESYDWVLKEFGKRTKIPGFQVGKSIPEPVLVNFVGKERVKTAAIEAVLRSTLPQALSSVAGRALKDSEHIVTNVNDLKSAFSPTAVLSYDVVVDVVPEVKWTTPDTYKKLKAVVEIDDKGEYQKAAEADFRSCHKSLGSLRIVQDRTVQTGDVVVLDVACNRVNDDGSDGERILSAEEKGFQLDTEDGISYLPGFVEEIIGMKRGETRSFELIFPETWQVEATRGATGRFVVECKEHFYRLLPALEDSLAGKFIDNCDTLDKVKETFLKNRKDEYELGKLRATQNVIMNELAKVTVVDVPNSLIEEQGRNMYAGKLLELQARMNMNAEQLSNLSNEQMVNNYLITQKQIIVDAVKQALAVAEIFKCENLQYSEEELNKEVENAEEDFKQFNQEYDKERVVEQAKELLEGAKVLDWLVTHADITYIKKKI